MRFDLIGALSPAELQALDRVLTPVEQKIVEDYQAAQADAALAAERKEVYTDPKTGQKRTAQVTYEEGPAMPWLGPMGKLLSITPKAKPVTPVPGVEWWKIAAYGLAALAMIGGLVSVGAAISDMRSNARTA